MRNRKQITPIKAIMIPGTMKDSPHAFETQMPAIKDPKIFPTDVCEFQMPMIKPRLARNKSPVVNVCLFWLSSQRHIGNPHIMVQHFVGISFMRSLRQFDQRFNLQINFPELLADSSHNLLPLTMLVGADED